MTQTETQTDQTESPEQQTTPRTRLRTREYHWHDPLIGAGAAQSLSGLDYLRGMVRGEYPAPPIGQTLGFSIASEDDVQPGKVTFTMRPEEYHYNPIGSVHGGVYATLLDSALGCAVHTMLPAGVGYTTLELKVNYLRPLKIGMADVRAVGEVLSVSRQVATAQAQLLDERGKLYAHATTTCLILRPTASDRAGEAGQ